MKKKLAIMCIMGTITLGLTACGNTTDSSDLETSATEETSAGTSGESSENDETEIEWVSEREDYIGLQDLDIDKYITLCDYANMTVSAEKPSVDDETIENYINNYLLVGSITNRAVEVGDTVNIDYVGKKDGEAFSGGTYSGYNLTIGSGTFIDGFEDGLVGVMPGETVDLNLTFPTDYSSTDLAGQDVVFTVTVNYIVGTAQYSSVTVEDMENMGLEYTSLEELWEAGKNDVEESSEETYNSNAINAIIEKVVDESEAIEIPQWFIDEQIQYYTLYLEEMASWYGYDLESFIEAAYGITLDEFNEETQEECQEVIKRFLVVEAIARAENIELTEDEVKSQADIEYADYGYESAETFLQNVGYTTYRISLLQDLVVDRLMEIIDVVPETVTE
jgi:trigger factor